MREIAIAKHIWELKKELDEVTKKEKEIKTLLEAAENELVNFLIESGKSSTGHISGVGSFTMGKEIYPSVNGNNLPGFIESLRGTDGFAIVKETIPAQLLKAYLNQEMDKTLQEYCEDDEKILEEFGEMLTPLEANKKHWENKGVSIFEKVKISHRNKGKE